MIITVDLPPAVHRRVVELAERRGQSLSATLAELAARGLSQLDEPVVVTDEASGFPVISIGHRITSDEVAAVLDETEDPHVMQGRTQTRVMLARLTARELDQDITAAKRAAGDGPVIITDRGQPAFVMLAIEDYRRLSGARSRLVSWLAMDDDEVVFDPEPADPTLRVPDL